MVIRKSLSEHLSVGLVRVIILLFNSYSYSLSQCHSTLTLLICDPIDLLLIRRQELICSAHFYIR